MHKALVLRGLIALLLLSATSAMAQVAGYEVAFDENGNGYFRPTPVGDPLPLHSLGNGVDPIDPTNGKTPLIYDLTSVGITPVPGDVLVTEPAETSVDVLPQLLANSDLLRFTASGLLIVYSDLPEPGETPDLADVGLPDTLQPNLIVLPETGPEGGINGLFGYQPTPNQPGFNTAPSVGFPIVYNFTSDVPEPACAGLLMILACSGTMRRRRAS